MADNARQSCCCGLGTGLLVYSTACKSVCVLLL